MVAQVSEAVNGGLVCYTTDMKQEIFRMPLKGTDLIAEFNDLADQAHGSVMIRYGDTVVLVTAVMSPDPKPGGDFFPLTVDYEEKFYATGQILGSRFVRREGKPSDEAILSGRIVDRTIRPLFDQYIRNEVQVIVTVLSIGAFDPDVLAVVGASLALGTSHIPWNGPVSAVRIGRSTEGGWIINPSYETRGADGYTFDLVACGKDGMINMIEVNAHEIAADQVMEALTEASKTIESIQQFQQEIIAKRGKEKVVIPPPAIPEDMQTLFATEIAPHLFAAVFENETKAERKANERELLRTWISHVAEKFPEHLGVAESMFDEAINDLVHKEAIENGRRADGRGVDDIRPLFVKAGGISPILHGSGIFYRGGTHWEARKIFW
jgi:polyribonucleotide nucleotidyltransferase